MKVPQCLLVTVQGEVVINAPEECPEAAMELFVREKQFWIYTKLGLRASLRVGTPRRQLVSGEGFPCLGRRYRLILVEEQETVLKLARGRFRLLRDEAAKGR